MTTLELAHWVNRCQACQGVFEHCARPAPDKVTRWGICQECMGKDMPCRLYAMV
jgi:hypothetical protein